MARAKTADEINKPRAMGASKAADKALEAYENLLFSSPKSIEKVETKAERDRETLSYVFTIFH